ncbi:MAG: hypothetical protein A2934_01085 [Candidatus Sungbacteria bacterium RIFCSPLOWO2_01_FULL_47_10]|uniref:Uncharacterized protein n=1 Tax=Candidatus Sungbacteria bacterium RIFCSPLOWO2_01_FULL_47_10 TaxID=1802276 RepID=A0A1G2L772_9BACT|nr:MAG: hypothetical protein A2934_01085 [Candidatus Sungbacteria bacterium RIFCSPLOWO2_01_FULL_47_10]
MSLNLYFDFPALQYRLSLAGMVRRLCTYRLIRTNKPIDFHEKNFEIKIQPASGSTFGEGE